MCILERKELDQFEAGHGDLEGVIDQLRLTKGIELQTFEHQFGKSFWDVYQDAADKLFSEQLLCLDESKKKSAPDGLWRGRQQLCAGGVFAGSLRSGESHAV